MHFRTELCVLMVHEGEILAQILDELSIKKSKLAEKLGVHRNTMTNILNASTIQIDRLIEIQKVIRYDLSDRFPKLKKVNTLSRPNEDIAIQESALKYGYDSNYLEKELDSCRKEVQSLNQRLADKDDLIHALKEQLSMAKKTGYRKHG